MTNNAGFLLVKRSASGALLRSLGLTLILIASLQSALAETIRSNSTSYSAIQSDGTWSVLLQ
jgi:hypothetical protein